MEPIIIILAGLVLLTIISSPRRADAVVVVVVPAERQSAGCLDKLISLMALFIALPFILYVASKTIA